MSDQIWQEVKLGDLAEYVTVGYVGPMAHEYQSSGIPFLRSQDIKPYRIDVSDITYISETFHEKIKKSALQPGDVVIVRTGRPGTSAVIPESLSVANCSDMVIVRPGANLDSRFLCYYINSIAQDHVSAYSVGAVQQHYNVGSAKELKILLPPLPEQRAIARILGALDDKIELNRRMNHTLEEMARATFKSWFVDFDPVTSKTEGRVPFGMNAETASLFPAEFEETGMGLTPKGWNTDKVSTICSTQYGYTTSASDDPIGSKFLRITDINKEPWIEWEKVPFCPTDEKIKEKYGLSIGDILVSRMADPGKAGLVEQDIDAVFASYLVRLKPKNLAWSYFLFYFLRSDQYLDYADGVMSGSVQLGMNAKVIVDADIVLPPDAIVESFYKKVHALRKKIVGNLTESNSLATIRDTLLPKLMSGEVRVKNGASGGVV